MADIARDPPTTNYLVAHIVEALATDARTNTLDVRVNVTGNRVFLIGQVASQQRRQAVEQVVRELLPPDVGLVNDLWVQTFTEPTETERLG
jgi:hypothetical protein